MRDPEDGLVWATARAGEVPDGDEWLGAREREVLAGLRVAPRRASWRLGRFLAKKLLGADVEILAAPGGRPCAWRGDARVPRGLSISHREELGVCAIVAEGEVGCDVERIEPRSAAFVADWFTPDEQARVAAAAEPALAANLIWSAKESALKALGVGLTRDTREVEVSVDGAALEVRDGAARLRGFWRREGDWVLTFVRAGIAPFTPE